MRTAGWIGTWTLAGAALLLAVLGAMTIGIFVLPFAPGEVCHRFTDGESCTQEFNPRPWLVAGLLVIGVAAAFLVRNGRQQRRVS